MCWTEFFKFFLLHRFMRACFDDWFIRQYIFSARVTKIYKISRVSFCAIFTFCQHIQRPFQAVFESFFGPHFLIPRRNKNLISNYIQNLWLKKISKGGASVGKTLTILMVGYKDSWNLYDRHVRVRSAPPTRHVRVRSSHIRRRQGKFLEKICKRTLSCRRSVR